MTNADIFNPPAFVPFCPGQNEMFPFLAEHGFAAIAFSEVQGIMEGPQEQGQGPKASWIFVKTGTLRYESVESVPVLVARYNLLAQKQPCAEPPQAREPALTTPAVPGPPASLLPERRALWKP